MKVFTGRFFSAIIPDKRQARVALKPREIYTLKDASHNTLVIHTLTPVVIADFLYDTGLRPDYGKKTLFDYPPLPEITIDKQKVEVKSHDYRFEPPLKFAVCRYGTKGLEYQLEKEVTARENRCSLALNEVKPGGDIVFSENSFLWQVARNVTENEYIQTIKTSVQRKPYLSVKDILDPETGLDRLIADILSKKFKVTTPARTGRLLDIIRSASAEEEEKIMSALYQEDREFFFMVYDDILNEDLLPYMQRSEVAQYLGQIEEEVLHQIAEKDRTIKNHYSRFFSRNSFRNLLEDASLQRKKAPSAQKQNNETGVFSRLIQQFKQHRQTWLRLPGDSFVFLKNEKRAVDDISASTRWDYLPGYAQSYSSVYLKKVNATQVALELTEPLFVFTVYIENKKNEFEKIEFSDIKEGILLIKTRGRLPVRILASGLGYDRKLHELIAIGLF